MALAKEDLQAIQALLEPIQAGQEKLSTRLDRLEESLQIVRNSQMKVELEQYPRIAAALDGVVGAAQRDEAQDKRIEYLEKKTDIHDTRLYSLETQIKKAL